MEDRFALWLKILYHQGFLDFEEINKIISGDIDLAENLFKDFKQHDKTAIRDFVLSQLFNLRKEI